MSFQINTNVDALNAYNALAKINSQATKASLRLATQKRINSVADDTSGYRVGKELEAKVSVMKAAQGNVASTKNMLATAESALSNVNDLLIQIKAKITDAQDPSKNKEALANDIKALGTEIQNIFTNTKFNATNLLSATSSFTVKTGDGSTETLTVNLSTDGTTALDSVANTTDGFISKITSLAKAGTTWATSDFTGIETADVDTTIAFTQNSLGRIGNWNQQLDVKDSYLTSAISNATASVSRLFDADMAMEQLNATKAQIGGQVATAMLSQLNSAPQQILSLFR